MIVHPYFTKFFFPSQAAARNFARSLWRQTPMLRAPDITNRLQRDHGLCLFSTKISHYELSVFREICCIHHQPGVSIHKERPSKLRVEAPTYKMAKEIAYHEIFRMKYNVYISFRDVEIEGVISDASLNIEDLKQAKGCFKSSKIAAQVEILDVRRLHSASLQKGKKNYRHSDSFRMTFAGPVPGGKTAYSELI